MPRTLGYHFVKSGYGLWLPGDERGHWSSAWDEQIGYTEPHMLHPADPVRLRMAEERMSHEPVRLSPTMLAIVEKTLQRCAERSPWRILAASLEPTHLHLQIEYTYLEIENTVKWISQEMTKAIHRDTSHSGPVFGKGRWLEFVFNPIHWKNLTVYIERHNLRRGNGPRPYSFLR